MKTIKALRSVQVGLALALACGAAMADAAAAPLDQRSAPPSTRGADVTAKAKPKVEVVPVATHPSAAARDEFRWRGKIESGRMVEILSLAGEVTIELSKGSDLEVVAIPRAVDGAAERVFVEVIEHARGVTVCAVLSEAESLGQAACRPGATEEAAPKAATGALAGFPGARVDYVLRVPAGVRVNSQNARGEVKQHLPASGDGMNLARIPLAPQPCPDARRP